MGVVERKRQWEAAMYDVVHAALWISGTNFPSLLLKYCLRRFWNVLCCSGFVLA